jgi:hypothetical protein
MISRRPNAVTVLRLVPAMLVMVSISIAAAPARAIAIWPTVTGFWAGFGQSSLLPAVQGQADLEITAQVRGLFRAVALLPAVQTPGIEGGSRLFFCDGSVQPSPERNVALLGNVINVVGVSQDGALILVMHGKTRAFGDGSVRVASFQYEVFSLLGNLLDGGIIAVLDRFGGAGWMNAGPPDVTGFYSGSYDVADRPGGGCIMADLRSILAGDAAVGQHATSGFLGNLEMEDNATQFDVTFGIQGTIGLPAVQRSGNTAAPIAMLGMSERGIIAVLISLLLPAVQTPGVNPLPTTIQGNYQLFSSLAEFHAFVVRGADTSYQSGGFQLPAVQ